MIKKIKLWFKGNEDPWLYEGGYMYLKDQEKQKQRGLDIFNNALKGKKRKGQD